MAIRHNLELSVTEPNNEVGNLKIRQGDEQTQTLVVQITENGIAKPFTGLQPFFCAKLGQTTGLGIVEQKVTGTMNPANGTLEYVMQPEDWQQIGRQTGYFSFRKMKNAHEWTEQFSTRDFAYNVIPSAIGEIREVKKDGSTYVWTIEDMLRLFKEYIATGKTDWENYKNDEKVAWEKFVEDNREFLETADPGGKIILELLGARGGATTLGERLDSENAEVSAQLQQNAPYLNNGKLTLPDNFPKLPFNIFKNKYGDFYSDASPYNVFDWSDAKQIYITSFGSSSGESHLTPTNLAVFKSNFLSGVYGDNRKFILNVLDYVYFVNNSGNNDMTIDIDADILIRSSSADKFSWFGRAKSPLLNSYTSNWVAENGIYKTTQTNNHDVIDVVNLTLLDEFKMPAIYKKVNSVDECQAIKGAFYRDGTNCYCNPYDNHNINDIILVVSQAVFHINQTFARMLIFENCGFLPSAYRTGTINNINARMYTFGCKYHRSLTNGMYLTGAYSVHNFDTVVSHATLDGFNYHTENENSLATEVNCIAYASGDTKLATGQPIHSNNGSTAHDGMYMLRVGSRYYDCEGPIVADVDNCYSISIGVEASGILDSTTGVRAAFYFYDRPGDTLETAKPKYVLECKGYGKNVEIGVRGTSKTYVANFMGNYNFEGDVKRSVEAW